MFAGAGSVGGVSWRLCDGGVVVGALPSARVLRSALLGVSGVGGGGGVVW